MVDSNLTISVSIEKKPIADDLEEIGRAFLRVSEELRDDEFGMDHHTVTVNGE